VRREQKPWRNRQNPLERCHVLREAPAVARVNHDAAAENDQIARKHRTRGLMQKRKMIGRVPRRVKGSELFLPNLHDVAIVQYFPGDWVTIVMTRPWMFPEMRRWVPLCNRGDTACMIEVTVRNEHVRQNRPRILQLRAEILQVTV
jgi:hypothetical protein